jgi:hypothetical protein
MNPLYIDHSDGKGPQRYPGVTLEDFKEAWISNIKGKLLEIDQKSIRPAREGDTKFLDTLTSQSVSLRGKIAKVNNCKTIEEVELIKL